METRELPNLGMGGKKNPSHLHLQNQTQWWWSWGRSGVCTREAHKSRQQKAGLVHPSPQGLMETRELHNLGVEKTVHSGGTQGTHPVRGDSGAPSDPQKKLGKKKKKSTGTVREEHREASPTIQTARVTTTKRERLTRHVGWVKREKRPSEARKRPQPTESFHVTHFKDSVSAPICRYNKDR